jgi:leucine dehydrogenase
MIKYIQGKENVEDLPEFDDHRLTTFLYDKESNLRGYIAIHRGGIARPAFGATRLWHYNSGIEAFRDTLKLSKMMSYKAALAGLRYGGGKGVIISRPSSLKNRNLLLKSYARRVNYLGGNFITGADVGLNKRDLKLMLKETSFMVGVTGNPEEFTALGLFYSIQACLREIFDREDIERRSFAIQGLGKVGVELLKLIYKDSAKIFIADIDEARVKAVKKMFPKVRAVRASEIHKQPVDVYSPCALSNSLNDKSIASLRCRIIVGGANNQLENDYIGELLYKLGILYAPDYVVNAGGLISAIDEFENISFSSRRTRKKVENIKNTLQQIFIKSRRIHKAPSLVANEMAEEIFNGDGL